ncbi:hypothetical protein BIW11_01218 [Tropilaelaps mercedesae]|uniref:Beat protein-like n=1 Tax=Tropilaelaps mercedesae TaxID=418985 RepID=A0A1V9XHL6_9ACAR|nr:hypothetical protein BIW11_01218 [Tropilaelaps mercedesae]
MAWRGSNVFQFTVLVRRLIGGTSSCLTISISADDDTARQTFTVEVYSAGGFSDVLPMVRALRLHRLDIPRTAYVGDSLWLNCSYDLESDAFYAVKWYFNDTEFYMYSNNKPDFFDAQGITLDAELYGGGRGATSKWARKIGTAASLLGPPEEASK